MKNSRKIISIILSLIMVMQILPVFATEGEAQAPVGGAGGGTAIPYLINDNFGADNLSGWDLIFSDGFGDDLAPDAMAKIVTTEEIKDAEGNGTGNYALKYEVTGDDGDTKSLWFNTHISRAVTRADGTEVAFAQGTDIVIETRMKQSSGYVTGENGTSSQSGGGRSFLKYNMTDHSIAEYNFDWGTLVRNNNGDLGGATGWKQQSDETNGTYYNYVSDYGVGLNKVNADEWYNVKVVISRTSEGKNIADYIITKDDGSLIGEAYDKSLDFPENSKWYSGKTYATEEDKVAWVEDVLNTIDFRQRKANTLYVDYVRAYEAKQETVQANLVDGRYVQFDGDIKVKLTTEAEQLIKIEDTVKVTNANGKAVEASVSYDAGNKLITINPTYDLTPNGIYNLTLTANEFNAFTGTTTYELEAREARSSGIVVNDTFDDLELGLTTNAGGWYLGAVADENYKGSMEIVNITSDTNAVGAKGNALKVEGEFNTIGNGEQTYVTRKIGGGIEYEEGRTIVIKTRFKHTANTARVMLVENRPDSLTLPTQTLAHNVYNIFTLHKTSGIYSYNGKVADDSQGAMDESAFVTGDLANKWIEATVELDGKTMTTTIDYEGNTGDPAVANNKSMTRVSRVFTNDYGIGTDKTAFDALERLGFTFRDTDDTLYIDSFKVYELYDDVKISVDETYMPGEAIEVKFNVPYGDATFLDAVKLFKGETEITEISKSINEANNVVTITTAQPLEPRAYKVKADTTVEGFPTYAYNVTDTTKTIHITDKKYLIYDEFGDDDTEDWKQKTYKGQTPDETITFGISDVSDNGGNYALKYVSPNTDAKWNYDYITKALPSPAEFASDKNVVIETRVKTHGTTGRTFFKYNLGATAPAYSNKEWNYAWGNLVANQKGIISLHNTYKTNSGYWYYAAGFGGTDAVGGNANVITDAIDKWYTYKVVIHGGTAGENHTATGNTADYYIYDEKGNELVAKTDFDIDFPDNSDWSATETGLNWLEDALYSVDFRLRETVTLEIDYVKVYEYTTAEVHVNTVEGKTFEAGKPIEFKVTAANGEEVSDTIVDTATVSVDAEKAYKDGVLTITPAEGAVEEGDTVTVTFANNDYVNFVNSTTSFALTARGARSEGLVVNSTFDGLDLGVTENAEGWYLGTVNDDANKGTLKIVDSTTDENAEGAEGKALKFTGVNAGIKNGYYSYLTGKVGEGIEYAENKNVVIKARIKRATDNGRVYFVENMADDGAAEGALGNNLYNIFTIHTTTGICPYQGVNTSGTGGMGEAFVPGGVAGKWLDIEVKIDGYNKKMTTTVYVEGENKPYIAADKSMVRNKDVVETNYGKGTTETAFKALERLGFFFRDTNDDLYIDYIKVYDETAMVDVRVPETVKYNKALKIKLETGADIEVDETVATITDVETAFEYDAETKTVILTPEEGLEEGKAYTVNIDKSAFEELGLIYEGETTFTVKARSNIIFDNQFNTAGNLEGWVLGETTVDASDYEYGVADGNMYLKINKGIDSSDTPALFLDFDDVDYEDGTTIVIEAKLKQTGDTGNHRSYLKLNRPNITSFSGIENGHNWYTLFALRGDSFQTTLNGDRSQMHSLLTPAAANVASGNFAGQDAYVTIELDGKNNKSYTTVTINGVKSETYEAIIKDGADALADAGAPATGFTAFDSLTWLFRSSAGANTLYIDYIKAYEKSNAKVTIDAAAMPGYDVKIKGNADIGAYINTGKDMPENITELVDLYNGENVVDVTKTHIEGTHKVVIDPKSDLAAGAYTVKFNKDAFAEQGYEIEGDTEFTVNVIEGADVNMNFEDAAEGEFADASWAFDENAEGTNGAANIVSENGNKFLRITANGKLSVSNMNTMINYSKTLTTPFVRDMKASTVFEVKMRTSANNVRKLIKFNNPDEGDKAVNAYGEIGWNTRVAAVMSKGNLGVAYKDYRDQNSQNQGNPETITAYDVEKWYTIKTIYHNSKGTASTYIYDEAGALVGSKENQPLAAWWYGYYDYSETQPQIMHSIDDITVRFRPEGTINLTEDEKFDIDDIKLYNITEVDEFATAKFMNGENRVTNIVEGITSVVPTFDIQSKNNEETEYYVIAAVYENGKLTNTYMKKEAVAGQKTITLDAIDVDYTNTGLVLKAFVWNTDMVPVSAAEKITPDVNIIYMSTYGNDSNMGYEDTPVASLDRAVELANAAVGKTSKVVVKDGTYELSGKPINITPSNLTAKSLTIEAENSKGAKFINGIAYKLSDADLVEEPAILNRLADDNAKTKLYVLDLTTKVDIKDIPKLNLPGTYSYFCDGYKYGSGENAGTYTITEPKAAPNEMFFGGKPMTLARYPDGNEYETLSVFTQNPNSVTRNWMSDKNTGAADSEYIPEASRELEGFTVTLERAEKWTNATDAYAFGFWGYDWATQTVPVASKDGVITSRYPSHYAMKAGQRYYVYNLLEEITAPGEYYIDRNKGLMYFMLPEGADINDESAEIIMSLYGDATNGIINISASNVTIDGLVFTASRGRAVKASGNNVTIKNCEISNTAAMAASVGGTNSVIEYCNIHDVNGGLSLTGGDTKTLTQGNNKVLNNTITNFSRLDKTYTPAIEITGVGNKASHNFISTSEHLAMKFSGVGHEISYNEIKDVLKEADDAGAIYAGRSWVSRDNVIKNNYIHNLYTSIDTTAQGKYAIGGIFLDDHYADVEVTGNIFADIEGYGMRGNKGREFTITNNIFDTCERGAVGFSASTGTSLISYFTANGFISAVEDLLKYSAWTEHPDYAEELFNDAKTGYNEDLLWSHGHTWINNFAANSGSSNPYHYGNIDFGAENFETTRNKNENNLFGAADLFSGGYANNKSVVDGFATEYGKTINFAEIPFAQIGTAGTAAR